MVDNAPPRQLENIGAGAAPMPEDERYDDIEYNPAAQEPKSAKAWLNMIEESEKAFEGWHQHCDLVEKAYGTLDRLADMSRDRQYQMFWANMEVMRPALYANPPIPVIVSKFRDRRPVIDAAAEFLERCCSVAF